jgi:hypothetical protein
MTGGFIGGVTTGPTGGKGITGPPFFFFFSDLEAALTPNITATIPPIASGTKRFMVTPVLA